MPRKLTRRRIVVVGSVFAGLLLAAFLITHRFGTENVNVMERSEYGDIYMQIRTDDACAVFPFIVTTGFTTTIHDTTTGRTWREPVLRRYYLWVGRSFRIGEWHRPKDAC